MNLGAESSIISTAVLCRPPAEERQKTIVADIVCLAAGLKHHIAVEMKPCEHRNEGAIKPPKSKMSLHADGLGEGEVGDTRWRLSRVRLISGEKEDRG